MSRNLITLPVTSELVAAMGAAIGQVEFQTQGLVALSNDDRRAVTKMGGKSEQFCRQTLHALRVHPQLVPPSIDLADAQADLDALDQLRPLFQRLHRLSQLASDSELALGADVMSAALAGYRVLKAVGRDEGLESLRKELGGRFTKSPRQVPEPAAA